MTEDATNDTHAQHVPSDFIPDGYIGVTNHTEKDLPALAEDIAVDTGAPVDEILGNLEGLVNEYNIPIVEADRSARRRFGGEDL